jgi:hypothetical protein
VEGVGSALWSIREPRSLVEEVLEETKGIDATAVDLANAVLGGQQSDTERDILMAFQERLQGLQDRTALSASSTAWPSWSPNRLIPLMQPSAAWHRSPSADCHKSSLGVRSCMCPSATDNLANIFKIFLTLLYQPNLTMSH